MTGLEDFEKGVDLQLGEGLLGVLGNYFDDGDVSLEYFGVEVLEQCVHYLHIS